VALMLTVVTWLWGTKYGPEYVDRLAAGLRRHLRQSHQFKVVHPAREDALLVERPGCFARLRMFDPAWQAAIGAGEGSRLVCMDLDSIVTGGLDPLFDRPDPFLILQGANAANPAPYNGSLWMLRAGYRPDVWLDFSLEASAHVPFYSFPDDQGWLAHKLPGENGWQAGARSGVYAFKKPGWPAGDDLPSDARLVCFPGHRDPSQFTHLGWVQKNWIG
jgi:hypothetical protein